MQKIDGVSPVTQTTTYTYYTNGTASNFLQSVAYPNGNWVYYTYDSLLRKSNEYAAYNNSTLPAGGAEPNPTNMACKVTQYSYETDIGG